MSCEDEEILFVQTVVVKKIDLKGFAIGDVVGFSATLTRESPPNESVTYDFPTEITKVGEQLHLTIPSSGAKSIAVAGKYLVQMRLTDNLGLRGISPCPNYLEFLP